jgi:hypothetical protein
MMPSGPAEDTAWLNASEISGSSGAVVLTSMEPQSPIPITVIRPAIVLSSLLIGTSITLYLLISLSSIFLKVAKFVSSNIWDGHHDTELDAQGFEPEAGHGDLYFAHIAAAGAMRSEEVDVRARNQFRVTGLSSSVTIGAAS